VTEEQDTGFNLLKLLGVLLAVFGVMAGPVAVGALWEWWRKRRAE
jgi:hypothetical protein